MTPNELLKDNISLYSKLDTERREHKAVLFRYRLAVGSLLTACIGLLVGLIRK